ncbi:MAG: DUF3352 domain-containing protein [Nocardioides sp.]|nr:DUF3352 domain-containing protein [Nocardioides sp.]
MSMTPGGPEYLDTTGPIEPPPSNDNRKRLIVVGALVAGGAVVAGGAWAATSFFATGSQPAEALPASTIAYMSVDLDPAGGQKIEAIRTLRKFPAFTDELDLETDDDLRERFFEEITSSGECEGLDYAADIKPWLGSRAAVAAVDVGQEQPAAVGVVEVTDAGAAEEGVAKLIETCGTAGDESVGGWVVEGDWLILAETDEIAADAASAAGESSLAGDASFERWTGEAGDDGFMSFYVAKSAAQYAEEFGGMGPMMGGMGALGAMPDAYSDEDPMAGAEEDVPDELQQIIDDFDGMAATVRFDDGSVEVEYAVSNYQEELTEFMASEEGADIVSGLPEDTVAAFGMGFKEGWAEAIVDYFKTTVPEETDAIDDGIAQMEEETGLSFPEDIETLMGEGVAVAVGSGIDPDAIANGGPGEVPVGIKIKGDADEIQAVLDKLKEAAGPEAADYMEVTGADGYAVLGLQEDFRTALESEAGLGDTEEFKQVIESAEAQSVLYVNFDADDDWLVRVSGESPEISENLAPLSAFGVSGWVDGDVIHGMFKLTTD